MSLKPSETMSILLTYALTNMEEIYCPAWLPIIIAIAKLMACFASNVNEECKLPVSE